MFDAIIIYVRGGGRKKKEVSPAGPHKLAKPHASSPHSFASQEASPVQEDLDKDQDLAVGGGEPTCKVKHHKQLNVKRFLIKKDTSSNRA